jgi:formate dehydrogenase subunit delta
MTDAHHLAQMANDIGNFFRAQPHDDAVTGIANHIKSYWTPRMRTKLAAHLGQGDDGLDELPREALRRLIERPASEVTPPPGGDAG